MAGYKDYLDHKLREALSQYSSEQTAFYNEARRNQSKWAEVKIPLNGTVKTKIAEWTEESKSWVWFDNPQKHLFTSVGVETSAGRIHFSVDVRGKTRFKVWGKVPNLVSATVGGSARTEIQIAGSTKLKEDGFEDTKIDVTKGRLRDVRFSSDVLHAMREWLESEMNKSIDKNEGDVREDLIEAVNGVTF